MPIFGHGVDLVEISRVERMLLEHGERFIERCFTHAERAYCECGDARRTERYASRLATKEAAFKALGTGWSGGISWTDVALEREPSGKPILKTSGVFASMSERAGILQWHVSVSHTAGIAIASVIGWSDPVDNSRRNIAR